MVTGAGLAASAKYSVLIERGQVFGQTYEVTADATVSRGGCLVQSDFGFMDASPDAQFRELARMLLADADASPVEASDPARTVVIR